jgi:hypothetical protein
MTLLSISYSGGKGFHLIFRDNDRTLFSIPDPKEREDAVRTARQDLLRRVLDRGFPVDPTVTSDTRRIIRLPGSLHGTTGWVCTRITREQLKTPLKKWVKALPRHPSALALRYWPLGPSDLLRWGKLRASKKKKQLDANRTTTEQEPLTVVQCSTQVVGTKGRSAFMAWIPKRWSEGHLSSVASRINELGWGPVHTFEHLQQTLLIAPRAIPKEQLAKEVATMGWPSMGGEIKQLGHAWLDIYPMLDGQGEASSTLVHKGAWKEAGSGSGKVPWSATHIELLHRLGSSVDLGDDEVAGRAEPAFRVVTKA